MSIVIRYEADSLGHIYAEYDDGEIIPTGITLPTLASRSHLSREDLDAAASTHKEPK